MSEEINSSSESHLRNGAGEEDEVNRRNWGGAASRGDEGPAGGPKEQEISPMDGQQPKTRKETPTEKVLLAELATVVTKPRQTTIKQGQVKDAFGDKPDVSFSRGRISGVPLAMLSPLADEEFHRLRARLFLRTPQAPRTILVTSSVPEEGKTVVAVNLALAISHQPPKRVILIDGDLRKLSALSEKYRDYKGLSNYLSEDVSISEVLIKTEATNLWIIPAGTPTKRVSELIGSERMNVLLTSLKSCNDDTYVIIDSPPVLLTSEPMLLSKVVDSVLLVISENTQEGTLRRALESLDHQKILGIVLNQSKHKARSKYTPAYFTQPNG